MARGREAALAVRRAKKAERLDRVRALEEAGVPRMQMRDELKRLGFRISQRQLQDDLRELGYGHRLARKHPPPAPRSCETCGEEFTPDGHQASQPGWGRFCSRACHYASRYVAELEERVCMYKGCGKTFTPYPSEAVRPGHGQFCSHRCRQLHAWDVGMTQARGLVEWWGWGRARQRHLGRWEGMKYGQLGGRKAVDLTEGQRAEAVKLRAQGWGRRAIASRLRVSEWAVRKALGS